MHQPCTNIAGANWNHASAAQRTAAKPNSSAIRTNSGQVLGRSRAADAATEMSRKAQIPNSTDADRPTASDGATPKR